MRTKRKLNRDKLYEKNQQKRLTEHDLREEYTSSKEFRSIKANYLEQKKQYKYEEKKILIQHQLI